MVDHLVYFEGEPTTTVNGITVEWFDVGIDPLNTMPQERTFNLGGAIWSLEASVIPGRDGFDKLYVYIMKSVDNVFQPVIDMTIPQGLQLIIDNVIRIYGFQVTPELADNYRSTDSTGNYLVVVSEV